MAFYGILAVAYAILRLDRERIRRKAERAQTGGRLRGLAS